MIIVHQSSLLRSKKEKAFPRIQRLSLHQSSDSSILRQANLEAHLVGYNDLEMDCQPLWPLTTKVRSVHLQMWEKILKAESERMFFKVGPEISWLNKVEDRGHFRQDKLISIYLPFFLRGKQIKSYFTTKISPARMWEQKYCTSLYFSTASGSKW